MIERIPGEYLPRERLGIVNGTKEHLLVLTPPMLPNVPERADKGFKVEHPVAPVLPLYFEDDAEKDDACPPEYGRIRLASHTLLRRVPQESGGSLSRVLP